MAAERTGETSAPVSKPVQRPVQRPMQRRSRGAILDGFFFVAAAVAAVWFAVLLIQQGLNLSWNTIWISLLFWVVLAYLVLPRIHKILTFLYVPDYFIGRTRTSDGLLGDPVNIALLGSEAQLHAALRAASWTRADNLSLGSGLKIVSSTLTRRSYDEAPVSPLLLFGRQQDFAYQQEVAGNPAKRHHVRFWRCPDGWLLPGGIRADWLAAGTFDRAVGFSLFTLQVTHKIEENTDIERDFIVQSLERAEPGVTVSVIEDFSTGYHARNGGGDAIVTDGDLPIVDLRAVPATVADAPVAPTDSRLRRPWSTVVGAILTLVGGVLNVVTVGELIAGLQDPQLQVEGGADAATVVQAVIVLVIGVFALVTLLDLVLAIFIFAGSNWARVFAMILALLAIVAAFLNAASGEVPIGLDLALVTVSIQILILLALSNDRARDWARRKQGAKFVDDLRNVQDAVTGVGRDLTRTRH